MRRMFTCFAMVSILFASADLAQPATRVTKIYVSGMTCGGCAISVKQVLENTEGVEDVRVSFDRGEAVVKYDDRKISANKLREVVQNVGFGASAKPYKKSRAVKAKETCCSSDTCDARPPG